MKTARMIVFIVFMFVFCGFLALITVHGRGDEGWQAILGYAAFAIIALILSVIRIVDYCRDRKDIQKTKNGESQPSG